MRSCHDCRRSVTLYTPYITAECLCSSYTYAQVTSTAEKVSHDTRVVVVYRGYGSCRDLACHFVQDTLSQFTCATVQAYLLTYLLTDGELLTRPRPSRDRRPQSKRYNLVPLLWTGVRLNPPGWTDKNLCRCFGAPARRIFPHHPIRVRDCRSLFCLPRDWPTRASSRSRAATRAKRRRQ